MNPSTRLYRHHRLVRGKDFQRVYRVGSRARGSLVTIAAAPNDLPHPRLGLSIGKSVWKHAVKRNRLRRVFREAFRLEQHVLPAGVDLVVIGSVPGVRPKLDEARLELVRLATKAWDRYLARAER